MDQGFWQDLKRRRVGRVTVAYVAIAFAALEGAELVLPRLGLPDQVLTALVILAVLGFPVALVLAWVFDLSSEGLKRTASDDEGPEAAGPGHRHAQGRATRTAALVAVTALFAAGAWFWIPRAPGFGPGDVNPNALLVLPFDVRGGEEVAYLREGMVDLVSTKLDGVGDLTVVDPAAAIARVGGGETGGYTVTEMARLASGLGAGRVIRGSVVWVGGNLQVRASAYGPGDQVRIDADVEGSSEELFSLVDQLVGSLVAGGLIDESTQLSSLEGLTTRSNEALRLYLTGVQNFRLGKGVTETYTLLTRAVAIDSTFALASYWAGYVAEFDEIGDPIPHFERAMRHSDRLGRRDGMRLSAALAGAERRHADAIRLYEALVARYPDDLAGWFQLGEQLAHTGMYSGKTEAEARPAYERVIAIDSAMAPAYYHLSVIAGQQGDTVALRKWAVHLEAAGVDSLTIGIIEMQRNLVTGELASARQAFDRVRLSESAIPPATLAGSLAQLMGSVLEYSPQAARDFLREYGELSLTDTSRIVTARRRARLESASGRFQEAERALEILAPDFPGVRAQDRAWVALHPASPPDHRLEAALRGLAALSPQPGSGEAAARHYLMARVALRLDRLEAFGESRNDLATMTPDAGPVGIFAADLLAELNALQALAEGDPEAGLEALLQASYWQADQPWLGFPEGSYLDGRVPDREPMFLRAELLHAAGRDSEAIRWYEVAAEGAWHRGPGLLRLAEIRDGQGSPAEAAALLERVRRLWADGDPDVEPLLQRAEEVISPPGEEGTGGGL